MEFSIKNTLLLHLLEKQQDDHFRNDSEGIHGDPKEIFCGDLICGSGLCGPSPAHRRRADHFTTHHRDADAPTAGGRIRTQGS